LQSILKVRNAGIEIIWVEGEEKFSIMIQHSIKVMV